MFGKFNENQLNVVTILGQNGYCLLANGHIRLRFQMSVNVKPFLGKVKPFRGVFVDNCKFMISVQIWGRGGEKEKGREMLAWGMWIMWITWCISAFSLKKGRDSGGQIST